MKDKTDRPKKPPIKLGERKGPKSGGAKGGGSGAEQQVGRFLKETPPGILAQLQAKRPLHNAQIAAERVEYPDRAELEAGTLTEERIAQLGFSGHELHGLLPGTTREAHHGRRHRRRRDRRGGGRGQGQSGGQGWGQSGGQGWGQSGGQSGGQGGQSGQGQTRSKPRGGRGGKTLPNPQTVFEEAQREYKARGFKPVGAPGPGQPLVMKIQNFQFFTLKKAQWYELLIKLQILTAHIWFCTEVSPEAMEWVAKITGYQVFTTHDNSRGGQAVCILLHPSIKVRGSQIDEDIAHVGRLSDLRPFIFVDFTYTNLDGVEEDGRVGVVHNKSMRGGEYATSGIRFGQNKLIAERHLVPNTTVAGDWNNIFPAAWMKEMSPFREAGCILVNPNSSTGTQIMGPSRLDAFVQFQPTAQLEEVQVLQWWALLTSGREPYDHAEVTGKDKRGISSRSGTGGPQTARRAASATRAARKPAAKKDRKTARTAD